MQQYFSMGVAVESNRCLAKEKVWRILLMSAPCVLQDFNTSAWAAMSRERQTSEY